MKLFALKDSSDRDGAIIAILAFYPSAGEYYLDMPEGSDPWSVPLLLSSFARRRVWEIGPEWASRWVRSRIVPPERQNLGEILRENGLDTYDDLRLLELSQGYNSQDDCFVEPLAPENAPAWFKERECSRLLEALPLRGKRVLAAFRDGSTALCPIAELASDRPELVRVLQDDALFSRMQLGAGGRCVQWGSSARVGAAELRALGINIPLNWEDIAAMAPATLVDAAEAAHLLGCSRQNVNALVKRGLLRPVKASPKSTLFLRADIRARMDS